MLQFMLMPFPPTMIFGCEIKQLGNFFEILIATVHKITWREPPFDTPNRVTPQ